jgi:hypothetical protein
MDMASTNFVWVDDGTDSAIPDGTFTVTGNKRWPRDDGRSRSKMKRCHRFTVPIQNMVSMTAGQVEITYVMATDTFLEDGLTTRSTIDEVSWWRNMQELKSQSIKAPLPKEVSPALFGLE